MIGVAASGKQRRGNFIHADAAMLDLCELFRPSKSKLVDNLTPSPNAFHLLEDVRLYLEQNSNPN